MKSAISTMKHFRNFEFARGFTLVELIVVMAVFLFIIGAGLGIFISIVQNQKRVLAEQQLLNQISYMEEYMSKALRMAKTDTAGDCIGQRNIYKPTRYDIGLEAYRGIKFINQSELDPSGDPVCQEFFLDNSDPDNIVLKELKNSDDDNDAVALTSSNLKINFIKFGINGTDGSDDLIPSTSDGIQPRVTILLNITIPGNANEPNRTIQTTVSRRTLNVSQSFQ